MTSLIPVAVQTTNDHGPADENSSHPYFSASDVDAQVQRVLTSATFRRSKRLGRFLQFTVEQLLSGHEASLKEYLVGVEVFRKHESFDPRVDSIVRVEARRLRAKLERYYLTEGREDDLVIQFRKGSYVPVVRRRADLPPYSEFSEVGCSTVEVCPFANLTAEPGGEYLCAGLTQDLIAGLTKVTGLRVTSRAGSGRPADYVIQGSFRQLGQRIRVSVQLIKAADQYYLWSETFEREASQLFVLHDEVAHAVVDAFAPVLASKH